MLKRLTSYVVMLILMVSTVGVRVTVQFCGGEYVGVRVNGVQFLSEVGQEMDCCTGDGDGCDACHHVHHQYQIESQYMGGQPVTVDAPWVLVSLCAGAFPNTNISLPTVEKDGDGQPGYFYGPPGHRDVTLSRRGLRAPPVWA